MTSHIAILGMGAIGSLMAFHWRGFTPFAVQRDGTPCQRTLIDQNNATHSFTLPAWQGEDLDWLVVCTKAADTLSALQTLAPALGAIKRILLIQNGMGQQQQVANWLVKQQHQPELWVGSSTEGAYRQADSVVVYAGVGQTVIGPWHGQHTATMDASPLPNTLLVDDMHERLLSKLAVNAVINPLTAYYRCRNGELLSDDQRALHLQQLAEEIEALYHALAWSLPSPWLPYVCGIAHATAHNRSSTLQDILAGRAHELAYINGYIQPFAQQQGIEMPKHDELITALSVKPLDLCEHNH